jgi:hypothetical protein
MVDDNMDKILKEDEDPINEDISFIQEMLTNIILDIEDMRDILNSCTKRVDKRNDFSVVFDYLNYAQGALVNAEEDLEKLNFSLFKSKTEAEDVIEKFLKGGMNND